LFIPTHPFLTKYQIIKKTPYISEQANVNPHL
jgi:hypothetical protein